MVLISGASALREVNLQPICSLLQLCFWCFQFVLGEILAELKEGEEEEEEEEEEKEKQVEDWAQNRSNN